MSHRALSKPQFRRNGVRNGPLVVKWRGLIARIDGLTLVDQKTVLSIAAISRYSSEPSSIDRYNAALSAFVLAGAYLNDRVPKRYVVELTYSAGAVHRIEVDVERAEDYYTRYCARRPAQNTLLLPTQCLAYVFASSAIAGEDNFVCDIHVDSAFSANYKDSTSSETF